jgi:hypothetical protein
MEANDHDTRTRSSQPIGSRVDAYFVRGQCGYRGRADDRAGVDMEETMTPLAAALPLLSPWSVR